MIKKEICDCGKRIEADRQALDLPQCEACAAKIPGNIAQQTRMIHAPKLSKDAIHELIRSAEKSYGFKLNIEDFDFLTYAVTSFVPALITKFVAGAKEHQQDGESFVASVNHQQEINNEILDLWNYKAALDYRAKLTKSQPPSKSSHSTSPVSNTDHRT